MPSDVLFVVIISMTALLWQLAFLFRCERALRFCEISWSSSYILQNMVDIVIVSLCDSQIGVLGLWEWRCLFALYHARCSMKNINSLQGTTEKGKTASWFVLRNMHASYAAALGNGVEGAQIGL